MSPPSNLPAVSDQPITIQLPPGFGYSNEQPDPDGDAVPLSHYLWILRRHVWKILAFITFGVAGTVIVSSRLTPIYESTATVDIDRRAPTGVLGQDSQTAAVNDADQFIATQIKLIQSDSVLRSIVQKYQPEKKVESAQDEQVPVAAREDAPVILKNLKVTRPANTYLLLITYRHADPRTAAEVANAVAQSYIMHTYNLRIMASTGLASFMEKQLEELKAKMERSSAAVVAFERELNVINPEEKTSILSTRLQQLNTDYTNAGTDRMSKEAAYNSVRSGAVGAAEASTQSESLRKLSERLDEANEKFAEVKTHYGAKHPEYLKAASQVAELQTQIDRSREALIGRALAEYRQARNRETLLETAVAETKVEFDKLNARSFEYRALKQEADADKLLYEELTRKIKEAGINATFQNSSIRLADPARPNLKPDFPDIRLNAILAFLFSSLLAVGAAVMSDVLDSTVRDPEHVARLQTRVIGSLPSVPAWHRSNLLPLVGPVSSNGTHGMSLNGNGAVSGRGAANGNGGVNGNGHSNRTRAYSRSDGFDEAIRTLRDSILLGDSERRLRSIIVTSATPREGKTTTAIHLAMAHASQKRRTLIIDGDLRRPGVHSRLGVANEKGLSDVITGGIPWRDGLAAMPGSDHLKILPSGPPSRRAADRIGSVLETILDEALKDYEFVIVDSPPLLGFAEPLQMSALTDGVVVVAKAGQTDRRALQSVLDALGRLKANVVGVVLNEVSEHTNARYHYYGYYGKYYSKYYKPSKS
jgi:succinoglycan biosynthesis transport protein ExoP